MITFKYTTSDKRLSIEEAEAGFILTDNSIGYSENLGQPDSWYMPNYLIEESVYTLYIPGTKEFYCALISHLENDKQAFINAFFVEPEWSR